MYSCQSCNSGNACTFASNGCGNPSIILFFSFLFFFQKKKKKQSCGGLPVVWFCASFIKISISRYQFSAAASSFQYKHCLD